MAKKGNSPKRRHPLSSWYTADDFERIVNAAGKLPKGRVKVELPDMNTGGLREQSLDRWEAMRIRLNYAASAWDFESRRRTRPPSPHDLKALRTVERAANDLVNVLYSDGKDETKAKASRHTVLFELSLAADQLGPKLGPYPQVSPFKWSVPGEGKDITYYGGDEQLRADIDVVIPVLRHFATWAKDAVRRVESREVLPNPRGPRKDMATDVLVKRVLVIWIDILGKKIRASRSAKGEACGPLVRFVEACLEPLGVELTPEAIYGRINDFKKLLHQLTA